MALADSLTPRISSAAHIATKTIAGKLITRAQNPMVPPKSLAAAGIQRRC
ncbi:hypothetical protein I553_6618 [Mycobacterium xenopi 4042]|uniref:Uncharacterized protein n=1 Tax=Mycobacterium xenopi 4042 TaxID=1299334 RepID=X8BHQ7_MYCXE|nr:hypothetical protein I553_6618 [Mycobacterium xenopi 4042]